MSNLYASHPNHAAIRAEMRQLQLGLRVPVSGVLLALIGASCTASAFLTLYAA